MLDNLLLDNVVCCFQLFLSSSFTDHALFLMTIEVLSLMTIEVVLEEPEAAGEQDEDEDGVGDRKGEDGGICSAI